MTTGKASDNGNDGVVEISDDERLDKMLKMSSTNIWEHVECDDAKLTFLGGNQDMSNQLPSHILPLNQDPLISPIVSVGSDYHGVCVPSHTLPLNHDPLISLAGRVGDHHGVCVPENMEDSQKVSSFHQLRIPFQQFGDTVDQLSKSQYSSIRKRQVYMIFFISGKFT